MVPNSKSDEGDTAKGKPPCLQPPSALWWGSHLRVLAYLHQCMLSPEGCEMHSFLLLVSHFLIRVNLDLDCILLRPV